MAKRRTKKQKKWAKHKFSASWKTEIPGFPSNLRANLVEANVKRQFKNKKSKDFHSKKLKKITKDMARTSVSGSVKKDIYKSLFFASIIVSLEIVLYLALNK